MKKLKKMLALVMVFTMVMSTVAFAAVPDDVKGTDYEEAASILGVLNIMNGDDGGFRPNDTITRAEFAAVVARALDLEDAAKVSGGSTDYDDVPSTHWAAGYIKLASDMGIINGYGNGNFGPEDTVKYEQALTMIVRALGYEPLATEKGGYPVGYLFVASNEGITDGIDAVSGIPALRGDVAQMINNALTVDIMEQTGYGDDSVFKKAEGKNILTEYLEVNKVVGVVAADFYADTDSVDEDEVKIELREVNNEDATGTAIYEIGDTDVASMLGYEVELYETDDVIFSAQKTDNNSDLFYALGDLEDLYAPWFNLNSDGEPIEFLFEDDDVNVRDAVFVLNGQIVDYTKYSMAEYGPMTDYLFHCNFFFINNDGDGNYDYVLCLAAKRVVVDEVLVDGNETIFVPLNTDPELVLKDDYEIVIVNYIDPNKTLENIKRYDVVEYAMHPTEDKYTLFPFPLAIEGTITEKEGNILTINGQEFELPYIGEVVDAEGNDITSDLDIGDSGTFYVDTGEFIVVALLDSDNTDSNYGYLLDSEASDEDFESGRKFKILIATGDEVIYEADDEIEVDGKEVGADDIYDGDATGKTDGVDGYVYLDEGQLIQYELNSNGEITEIYTVDSDEFDADGSMEDARFNEDTRKMYVKTGDDITDSELLAKDTLVFFIDTTDEDDSDVYTIADISDEDVFEDVYYYTENGDLEVIVIVDNEFSGASTDYEIAVVDRVTEVKNDSDDKVAKLYGYIKGEEVVKLAEDGVSDLDDADEGDILYITYNSDGEIDGVEKVEFNNGTGVAFAVYDKDSESITIWKGGKEVSESFASTYYVYKIDESADEFTVESYSDIKTKDKNGDNYSGVALGLNDDEQVEVIVIYSE